MKYVLCIFIPLIVTGCLSTEELRKQDAAKCVGYGYKVNTPQFAQCMMQMDRQRERARECLSVSLGAYSAARQGQEAGDMSRANADCMAGRPISPPSQQRLPKNTSCTQSGNTINCVTN